MPDIVIHNETDYKLTPLMLDSIKSDAIEHFGEFIHAIRVQPGIARHAFNTKTREVRYAFYARDFEVDDPAISFYQHEKRNLLPDFNDVEEDENLLAGIDDELDELDNDSDSKFDGLNPDYDSIETSDAESFYEDNEAIEPSNS